MAKVTICVPARNEVKNIGALLDRLLKVDVEDFEIIIVSDESTDGTDELVKRMQRTNPNLILMRSPKRMGKPHALNKILSIKPKEQIIVVVDADCLPMEGAIPKLLKHFDDPLVGLVSGHAIPIYNCGRIIDYWGDIVYEYVNYKLKEESKMGNVISVVGGFYAVRCEALTELPENVLNDDKFAAFHVAKAGYKVIYEPEAGVQLVPPKTIRDLYQQLRRWLCGMYQFHDRCPVHIKTLSRRYGIGYLWGIIKKGRFNLFTIIKILLLGIFYIVADVSGLILFKTKRYTPTWKCIETTKVNIVNVDGWEN